MKDHKTLLKLQEKIVPWLALALSCVTLVWTIVENRQANKNAQLALEYASQANRIALGTVSEYPQVEALCPDSGALSLRHAGHFEAWEFWVGLRNTGGVPIDRVLVRFYPLPFWTMNPEYPGEDAGFREMEAGVEFEEQLVSSGTAVVDLTPLFVKYLRQARWSGTWSAGVKVVFVPRRLGEDLPVRVSGTAEGDTCFYAIESSGEFLRSAEVQAFMDDHATADVVIIPPDATER